MKKAKRKAKKVSSGSNFGLNLRAQDIVIVGGGFALIVLMSMLILGGNRNEVVAEQPMDYPSTTSTPLSVTPTPDVVMY